MDLDHRLILTTCVCGAVGVLLPLLILTPLKGMVGYGLAADLGFLAASGYTIRASQKLVNRKNDVIAIATNIVVAKQEQLAKIIDENQRLKRELNDL